MKFVPNRRLQLIGSYPAATAEQAMREALTLAGPCLGALPDGETGERQMWIAPFVEALRAHPDLEVRNEGDWSDYDHLLSLRVRRGHRLDGSTIHFGYPREQAASRPVFEALRDEYARPDLPFQIGMPSGLGMAMFTMGPTGPFRYRKAFTEAIGREITEIRRADDDVIVLLELPAELVFAATAPAPLRPLVSAWLARCLAETVRATPVGTRFALHLCLGDLGHRALRRLRDTSPIVTLARAISARWPAGYPLEFVHAPFAAGDEPPTLDPAFYAPLRGLRLPAGTRFVAGMLHEGRSSDELRAVLGLVEDAVGHEVDLAPACGLGRRTPETAEHLLRAAVELCGAPATRD